MKLLRRDLHRIKDNKSDWERIPESEWNPHQRRAAKTKGIDTPGNRETAKGLIMSLAGIYLIAEEHPVIGVALLGEGRRRDLKDGERAEETGTKGKVGEAFDAAADKIIAAFGLFKFVSTGIMTPLEGAVIGAQNMANTGATAYAKTKGREIHATRISKAAAAGQSADMIGHGIGAAVTAIGFPEVGEKIHTISRRVGIGTTLTLGAIGTAEIVMQAMSPGNEQDDTQQVASGNIPATIPALELASPAE